MKERKGERTRKILSPKISAKGPTAPYPTSHCLRHIPSGFGQVVANPSRIGAGKGAGKGLVGSLGAVGRSPLIFGIRIFRVLSSSLSFTHTH